MYSNDLLMKAYEAGAEIAPYRIVKFDAADGKVIVGAAATDKLVGVSGPTITVPSGQRVDVVHAGIAEVKAGGSITRGDLLTSDATGQAVTAAPAAGTNNRVIGIALRSAASGDVFPVLVQPGSHQG